MSIGNISEFHVQSGVWSCYADRLEMYFKINKIEDHIKLPTLISVMGDEAYQLLVNLARPKKPSELQYSEATELLLHHLQPTQSVHAERYRFRQSRQGPEQSVSDYVAELNRLARYCNYNNGYSEILRDQFICGVRNDLIRQRLFAEDENLNFMNAIKIATSLEVAERAAVEACSVTEAAGSVVDLFAMHARGARAEGVRPHHAGAGGSESDAGRAYAQHGRAGGSGARSNQAHYCRSCGVTSHYYGDCRYRVYVCSLCRRRGHLQRVCPSPYSTGPRRQRHTRQFNYGDAADEMDAATE